MKPFCLMLPRRGARNNSETYTLNLHLDLERQQQVL